MPIIIDRKNNIFKIDTENISYIFGADIAGNLLHYYYGAKVADIDLSYLNLKMEMPSTSALQGESENLYSMNILMQEYSTMDSGDYRISALEVKGENGTLSTNLKFVSANVKEGKYSLSGLPAVYAELGEAETLEVLLKDNLTGLEVKLLYSVINGFDAIMRSAVLHNTGEKRLCLQKAASCCLDFPSKDYSLLHLHGKWAAERNIEIEKLTHDIRTISSKRGTSSHIHNPFVALLSDGANEFYGDVYGVALAYSGNFSIETECDSCDQTRLIAGINPQNFSWVLESNEEFTVPEAIITYSSDGLNDISNIYHKLFRTHLCRGKWRDLPRPILINNWEATYFNFDEQKIYDIAKSASSLGIEMLVLDDGWFGKRNDDTSSLGDWFANEQKLKGGLSELVNRINALGMKFGLWFEPEMISPKSELFAKHPEWVLCANGRTPSIARNQYVLDLTRQEVRDYLFDSISKVLDSANIEYIKWDFNRYLTETGSDILPSERQLEVSHRYVLGLYELLERIIEKYPDLLIESCSGGGGRFDAGMLYYTPQIWTSDNTDAIDRAKIQCGTSVVYPLSCISAHVSVCPNHQTKRTLPFSTRGNVALTGAFGYELDITKLTEEERHLVKVQITFYNKWKKVIATGDFYRLVNPFLQENYCATEIVSNDKNKVIVTFVVLRAKFHTMINIKLKGLDADKKYICEQTGREYYGSTLMNAGLQFSERYYFRDGHSKLLTFICQ